MRRDTRIFASLSGESSGNPYAQAGFVRCAVEVSIRITSEPSARAVLSFAASSGRQRKAAYGNAADDGVENYYYDYYFDNDASLEEAEVNFTKLMRDILEGNDLSGN